MSMFRNSNNEVRSGWKIAAVIGTMFGFSILTSLILGIILGIYLVATGNVNGGEVSTTLITGNSLMNAVAMILSNIATIAAVILMWKVFQKKRVSDMGLINIKKGAKELLIGLLIGAVTITIIAASLIAFGDVELVNSITNPSISSSLLFGLIGFIFVGFGEEMLARGFCMSVMKQTKNKWLVLFVPAIIFSALHLANPGIAPLALINLFLAGVVFAYMFMKTKNLWMPIGFHITWNYFQGNIWGFQVSGNVTDGLYQIKTVSNNIINGGEFGPEGGLVVTVVLLITLAILYVCYKDNKIEDFMEY
ncbi:MAG: CPBP family intramembrane glutamic endopeptidase [Clostridium sp.]